MSSKYIGQRVGIYKVIDSYTEKRKTHLVCLCGLCGSNKTIQLSSFLAAIDNTRTSRKPKYEKCSCNFRDNFQRLLLQAKRNAEKRSLKFTVTLDDVKNVWQRQRGICALSGRLLLIDSRDGLTTASLDRIDSDKGYTRQNIQWIDKDINTMKSNFDIKYFVHTCKEIARCQDV